MENIAYTAGTAGGVSALLVSIVLVLSTHLHGKHSLDSDAGVQKFHTRPTPRIGGLALMAGFLAAWPFLEGEARGLWGLIGIAGLPAFASGLAEDITKKISVRWRLLVTIGSGLLFALLSGYTITAVDVPGLDSLLALPFVALAFTAFAVGGVANSINLIDGFHGLASGTLIIILLSFALVGVRVDDMVIATVAITMLLVLAGFFVVNFPHGKLFLGDAGAYFAGYVVAVLGVMLPARNPEVSPWVSLLILGYPVTETLFSILRRQHKAGHGAGEPDSEHLHHMVHRGWALKATRNMRFVEAKNAVTSVFVWVLPMFSLLAVVISDLHMVQSILLWTVLVVIYLIIYLTTGAAFRRQNSETGK
jgi:UDP-N-acetylmuramyl pentapeptide phosphotransferase/UDP-N-acetylglucosamine-1-phosphate transferase